MTKREYTRWIAIDWGTTSLRAWAIGGTTATLAGVAQAYSTLNDAAQ